MFKLYARGHKQKLKEAKCRESINIRKPSIERIVEKHVTASVHGYAVAYGAGLLAASDLAIAAEGTKIGTTAVNIDLFCMGGCGSTRFKIHEVPAAPCVTDDAGDGVNAFLNNQKPFWKEK